MVVDPQYNRGTDCMPFPCFFLRTGKESAILYAMSRKKQL